MLYALSFVPSPWEVGWASLGSQQAERKFHQALESAADPTRLKLSLALSFCDTCPMEDPGWPVVDYRTLFLRLWTELLSLLLLTAPFLGHLSVPGPWARGSVQGETSVCGSCPT